MIELGQFCVVFSLVIIIIIIIIIIPTDGVVPSEPASSFSPRYAKILFIN